MDYVCVMHVRRRTGLGSVLRDYLRAERSVRFEETCIRVVLLRTINLSITLPSLHTYLPPRQSGWRGLRDSTDHPMRPNSVSVPFSGLFDV